MLLGKMQRCFLGNFKTGSKPSRRSITATKRYKKEKQEKAKKLERTKSSKTWSQNFDFGSCLSKNVLKGGSYVERKACCPLSNKELDQLTTYIFKKPLQLPVTWSCHCPTTVSLILNEYNPLSLMCTLLIFNQIFFFSLFPPVAKSFVCGTL